MPSKRIVSYASAIQEATNQLMEKYEQVILLGLGVPDPKGIFGTTLNLQQKYGSTRVFDTPVSENALTGICIGTAIRGLRPILTHQRVDFSLLSFDQIINNAAKWYFMFGGVQSVPMVIRMIIGRGWGQGAQHSQSLQALFAHIPGLKVIMPTTAYDAKGLLISAVEDNNPVIILEHRWLYNLTDDVPEKMYRVPLGAANVLQKGNNISIISTSFSTIEALAAANALRTKGISVEVIDLRSIRPLDVQTITKSVTKTGRALIVDTGWTTGGISAEIITKIVETCFNKLKLSPQRLCLPDIPTPSAASLTKKFYPDKIIIATKVLNMLGKNKMIAEKLFPKSSVMHDVPDPTFTGPF